MQAELFPVPIRRDGDPCIVSSAGILHAWEDLRSGDLEGALGAARAAQDGISRDAHRIPIRTMSTPDPKTGTASTAGAGKAGGIGRVLDGVRQPGEVREPHVVEFRDVTKTSMLGRSNEFTAIHDVTFVVEDLVGKGEFICILGPSGSGKSTILRLIAGLRPQHPPTSGEVLVMGEGVSGPGADRGMVFQDYTSFDHRTVLDNVSFGLECQGVPRRERYEHAQRWIAAGGS